MLSDSRSSKLFQFVIVLLVLSSAISLRAEAPSRSLDSHLIAYGVDALYNQDYTSAFKTFNQIIQGYPEDPRGYFGRSLACWWQLETKLGEFSKEDETAFRQAVGQTIDVAKKAIDRDNRNAEAFLCLGGAYGLRGRWQASQHNWLRALFDGRRARRYQSKAIEIDPHLEDAYLGVGLFDYYVAALPKIVQALSFLGGGDKERGLAELHRAATQSIYSRTAARLILIGVYANTERKPEEALKITRELRAEYPESPFMHQLELQVLFENRAGPEMQKEAESFIRKSQAGAGLYASKGLTRGYNLLGASLCLQGQWRKAVNVLSQAIQEARPSDPYLTASLVHRGEAYDMLGERGLATADYRKALDAPKLWDYKKDAERYLRKPYQPLTSVASVVPSLGNQPQ